jgi:hypothetical protein
MDLMFLIGGAEERQAAPYIRLLKTSNHYKFTLKMATAMSSETLDNSQHSTRLIPESRDCTMNK